MNSIDEAKKIALDYAQKENPDVKDMKFSSAKQKGDEWVIELSWPINKETVTGTQYVTITISNSGEIKGYTPRFSGIGIG